MDDVKTRLDKAIELSGARSRRAFAALIEIPYDTMNKWIDRGAITPAGILKITSVVPISRTYLETGTGDPELNDLGISNYAHNDREKDIIGFYRKINTDEKKLFYKIMKLVSENQQ